MQRGTFQGPFEACCLVVLSARGSGIALDASFAQASHGKKDHGVMLKWFCLSGSIFVEHFV